MSRTHPRMLRGAVIAGLSLAFLAGGAVTMAAPASSEASASHAGALTVSVGKPISGRFIRVTGRASTGISDAFCRANFDVPCYSPQEMQKAYGESSLIGSGFNGAGQTIVIIDSYGSPTIRQDLHSFDTAYGLPDPPSFQVISPLGTVPFDPNTYPDQYSWAAETTLDVEWAHAMAPGASIDLMTSPVDETEGVQGLPQFMALEQYALDHHLGQIWSQSWAATETTLFTASGEQLMNQMNALYRTAGESGVSVLGSAGDTGNLGYDLNFNLPLNTVAQFPTSSPWVTSVGGTTLYADTGGQYQTETVWNGGQPFNGATGGGISRYFAEPDYQRTTLPAAMQARLAGKRGYPDISFNADPGSPVLIYLSYFGPDYAGFYFIGGTSEGSPALSGVIADVNQEVGHPLGFLNPLLYRIGSTNFNHLAFHDVVSGNNGQGGTTGYAAGPGYDLTTGWGSPAAGFGLVVKALTSTTH